MKCALHNLGNMMFQGAQLLTYRDAEYTRSLAEETEVMAEMGWSDGDEEYGIEDDVPLGGNRARVKPSRAWVAAHCISEDANNEWSQEVQNNQASRGLAQRVGGVFNEMDGQFH